MSDLEPLSQTLIEQLNRKHHTKVKAVDGSLLEAFRRHSWPGNIRELRNTLERMMVLSAGEVLRSSDLPADFGKSATAAMGDELHLRPGMTVGEAEKRLIFETLAFTNNNKTRAAEMLGISLKTLHNKLKEYEAEPQS